MSEDQNTPEENLPGKKPEHIPQTQVAGSTTTQTQQEMEVHHHGHVRENSKWKEYGFQFIMLFLAVVLGFLAEKFRDSLENKNKEHEYMLSLIKDIENDSVTIVQAYDLIYTQMRKIDTLQELFSSGLKNGSPEVKKCYTLSDNILQYYPVLFNERTISQLTSSGNMRLIKKSDVAENIMQYYNSVKSVEKQGQFYIDGILECMDIMYDVYDIEYLRTRFVVKQDTTITGQDTTISSKDTIMHVNAGATSLLSTDPFKLKKLIAVMQGTKIAANNYLLKLSNMSDQAVQMLVFLRDKYK